MVRRYFIIVYGPNLPNLHCLEKFAAFVSITAVKPPSPTLCPESLRARTEPIRRQAIVKAVSMPAGAEKFAQDQSVAIAAEGLSQC
jgi:hypothetical protein